MGFVLKFFEKGYGGLFYNRLLNKSEMIVGKVVGSLVATRKNENLVGSKFMIVEPCKSMTGDLRQFVAVDNVGAGIGETVLVATGSAARIGVGNETAPIDAAIVGIVDEGLGIDF